MIASCPICRRWNSACSVCSRCWHPSSTQMHRNQLATETVEHATILQFKDAVALRSSGEAGHEKTPFVESLNVESVYSKAFVKTTHLFRFLQHCLACAVTSFHLGGEATASRCKCSRRPSSRASRDTWTWICHLQSQHCLASSPTSSSPAPPSSRSSASCSSE